MADLATKLQLKGSTIRVLCAPDDLVIDLPQDADASNVLLFVCTSTDLDGRVDPVLAATRHDHLAWVAYPKAGQLATDLNRDSLTLAMQTRGVRPVRQVSIDEIWSALRFRLKP